ncbi:hypothetical protein YC2023_107993 [Brassica napus]
MAGFLEGLWPFRPRKFEAITGLSLQLLVFNEEFLVSASHQLALTTSLPFVHTSRRSYRLNDPVKCLDRGDVGSSPSATSREVNLRKDHCRTLETERPENDETSLSVGRFLTVPADSVFWLDRTHSFRISPNPGTKSVKENATKQPAFANPETVFVRKQCCNVKSKTTLGNGYLGSRIDEERSEMRYLNPVNHRVFERKLRPKPSGRGHVCLGVTNRRPCYEHVWIAINQDKKRRPIRPRLAQAKTTSKRREREPTSGEREAGTSLEKRNPFLFPKPDDEPHIKLKLLTRQIYQRKPFVDPISDAPTLAETIHGADLSSWNPNPSQQDFSIQIQILRSGPKALDDPKSSTRPQVRLDHPLSLSISISGGKETNKDSLSNGERTGKSPA